MPWDADLSVHAEWCAKRMEQMGDKILSNTNHETMFDFHHPSVLSAFNTRCSKMQCCDVTLNIANASMELRPLLHTQNTCSQYSQTLMCVQGIKKNLCVQGIKKNLRSFAQSEQLI